MSTTSGGHLPTFPRRPLFDTLEKATGRSYHSYVSDPFADALRHRLKSCDIDDVDSYLDRLARDRDEALALERRALVGVTHFFRNPRAFEALGERLLERLARHDDRDAPLRIWVPACSTGQEAYSLAILLHTILPFDTGLPPLRIVGSDINAEAIEFARRARFDSRQMRGLDDEHRENFFFQSDDHYEPLPLLRNSIWFTIHDLLEPSPFRELDLISCRNLLIYLRPDFQSRVLESFAERLRPGGLLFLGASETTATNCANFTLLDSDHRIYAAT